VCHEPPPIEVEMGNPATAVAVERLMVVPSPTCPSEL
jgi:hypothetical protein